MSDRVLPHDLEAERDILGAIQVDQKAWPIVAPIVVADDFYRDAHRRIFAAMQRLLARGDPIDTVTLKDELIRSGDLDEVGGPAYLAGLTDGIPRGTNVEYYAKIVREHSRRRSAIDVASKLLSDAYDGASGTSGEIIDRAIADLSRAASVSAGGLIAAQQAVRDYVDQLVAGTIAEALPTGYADLDALTGGFRRGDLIIVAGRPSTGKTSFALGAAEHMAERKHHGVVFSLEMSARKLGSRLLAWRSRVPTRRIERNEATAEQYGRVAAASEAAASQELPLWFETSSSTMTDIRAWCRRVKQEHGLAVVVVDYLQLLLPERRRESDEAEVAGISRALKRLAIDLDVAVVALSQLSRAPEARKDKRPLPSDLRSSGALEQDADLVVLLFREEMYNATEENAGIAEAIVAKNRDGPTGVVRLVWLAELAEFRNLAGHVS